MAFSATADSILASGSETCGVRLELRTGHAESNTWQEYEMESWRFVAAGDDPAVLRAVLLDHDYSMGSENDPAQRVQMGAEVRFTAIIGSEEEVPLLGRVNDIDNTDGKVRIACSDWAVLLNERTGDVSIDTDKVEVADEETPRRVFLQAGGAYGAVWGFDPDGSGTDPAFDEDTQRLRRPWYPGNIRLFYDSAMETEVPPAHYKAYLTQGAFQILEDTSGKEYWATGVYAVLEQQASGNTKEVDFNEGFRQIVGAAKPDGIGAGGGEMELSDIGLSFAGPLAFPAEPNHSGLGREWVRWMRERTQQNLKFYYDSRAGKWTSRIVEQLPEGDGGIIQMLHAQSITRPRSLAELYSRVKITGKSERPVNELAQPGVTISSLERADEDFFPWNGHDVGADTDFNSVKAYLVDGDVNLGVSLHNLNGNGDIVEGPTPYGGWYGFVVCDFGAVERVQRIRLNLPQSRNPNAGMGDLRKQDDPGAVGFWPGVWIQGSLNGSDWFEISPNLWRRTGRPGSEIEAAGTQLTVREMRYIRVICRPYKHGISNQSTPSIGLGELEVFLSDHYVHDFSYQDTDPDAYLRYSASQTLPITAADNGAGSLSVEGDETGTFTAGYQFGVPFGSDHTGVYTVVSSSYSIGDDETTILVEEAVASSSAEGEIHTEILPTYNPFLLAKLSGGTRMYHRDLGTLVNEFLGRDFAIQMLDELSRLFATVGYVAAGFDPRIDRWDTVAISDNFYGNLGSMFVERVEHWQDAPRNGPTGLQASPIQTRIETTDYLAEVLAAP